MVYSAQTMMMNDTLEQFELKTIVALYPDLLIMSTPCLAWGKSTEERKELKKLFKRARNEINKLTR